MKKLGILVLIFIPFLAHPQTLAQKIKLRYQVFTNQISLKQASFSFTVLDANTGIVVFASDPNRGLVPASTLKVLTSATALKLLGENFTFKTDITYTGSIVNQILEGNLIIKGNGDPTLGSNRWERTNKPHVLQAILQSLQKMGIKKINGKIIADDSAWDTQSLPNSWIWQDIGNYYGASTSALCWGENQFKLSVVPGKTVGATVGLANKFDYPFLNIINEVETGVVNSGDKVYAYSAPYTPLIYLRGTYGINLKKEIGLALPDPALAMAYDLQNFLAKNEIRVNDITTTRISEPSLKSFVNATNLLTLVSPPLKEIVYQLNQKSINLYAEQLLRTLAFTKGKSASFEEGIKIISGEWKTSITPASLNIYDGSGLSPANRVTTLAMATVLYQAQKQPWFSAFHQSLPINNNQKMKSGTVADVLAYAGYQKNANNNLCFSVMVNNYSGSETAMRQQLFNLLDVLK